MRKTISVLVAVGLVLGFTLAMAVPVWADATPDHYVDSAGSNTAPYDTRAKAAHKIQDAIAAASDNDTIIVAAGLYKENVVIDKGLTLKGTQAGVDARNRSGAETILETDIDHAGISIITTDGRVVVIDGLTVQNGGQGIINSEYVQAGLGVKAIITVKNVRVLNPGEFGISLTFTVNATVEYCYVENAVIAINAGAVLPAPPTNATFRNNKVVNSEFGITGYLRDSLIEGNLIRDFANGGVGISCQCLNTTIKSNTVTNYAKGTAMTFEKSHHDRPSSENVTVIGNNFTRNRHGIHVFDTQETLRGITVNFNNIAGNFLSGVSNDKDQTLNANRNWWGNATGPSAFGPGDGDGVADNVDFEPWLGAAIVTVKTETVTNKTIDCRDEADAEIAVNGTATVTVVQYADNPGGNATRCLTPLHKYIDVYAPNPAQLARLEIKLYYTNDELTTANISEESLELFSWNGAAWLQCSDSGVNTTGTNNYSGYMWAKIGSNTTPSLANLQGTPFGGYGLRSLVLFIATTELPDGQEGAAYEARLEACVGAEPYIWAITNGALPDGLTLDTKTGMVSGAPTRADVFDFTVTVTDAAQITATRELSITIKKKSICFVATAAYGTDTARGIDILREFRDEVLLPDSLGARLVSLYYQVSPPIARLISEHEALRTAVRVGFVGAVVAILGWSHD